MVLLKHLHSNLSNFNNKTSRAMTLRTCHQARIKFQINMPRAHQICTIMLLTKHLQQVQRQLNRHWQL